MSDALARKRTSRMTLLLVAAVAFLPLLAAYGLYFYWRPSSFTNHGELLSPTSLADTSVPQADGSRPVLRSRRKSQVRSVKMRRRPLHRDMARIILEEMHTFVALLDARGNLMEVNRTALTDAGVSREEVVGCPLWQTPCGSMQ